MRKISLPVQSDEGTEARFESNKLISILQWDSGLAPTLGKWMWAYIRMFSVLQLILTESF